MADINNVPGTDDREKKENEASLDEPKENQAGTAEAEGSTGDGAHVEE